MMPGFPAVRGTPCGPAVSAAVFLEVFALVTIIILAFDFTFKILYIMGLI